jgi:hypothetical protein
MSKYPTNKELNKFRYVKAFQAKSKVIEIISESEFAQYLEKAKK